VAAAGVLLVGLTGCGTQTIVRTITAVHDTGSGTQTAAAQGATTAPATAPSTTTAAPTFAYPACPQADTDWVRAALSLANIGTPDGNASASTATQTLGSELQTLGEQANAANDTSGEVAYTNAAEFFIEDSLTISQQGQLADDTNDAVDPAKTLLTTECALDGSNLTQGYDGNPASTTTTTTAAPASTTPSPGQPSGAGTKTTPKGPGATLRAHLQDLASGQYRAAFDLMSASYQAQNPLWIQHRSAADPAIVVISVGTPQHGSGGAQVPVDFYARDRYPAPGSDTRCRQFEGMASMVTEGGAWRYDPNGSSLSATVVSSSNPSCL
jgi:hypothetical protein